MAGACELRGRVLVGLTSSSGWRAKHGMVDNTSWEDLAAELKKIKHAGEPLSVDWLAHVGSEDFGIWHLRPDGPDTDEVRATFSLIAARAIEKLGIPPIPIPQPSQYFPDWKFYCEVKAGLARLEGKEMDLSDAIPYGLAVVDLDAVDPCSRAWLEVLRRESISFRISSTGELTLRGKKYPTSSGTIPDLCAASAAYCLRRARDEIRSRLIGRSEQASRIMEPLASVAQPVSETNPISRVPVRGNHPPSRPPRRKPDVKTSQERLALLTQLEQELATINQTVNARTATTLAALRRRYPKFQIWKLKPSGIDLNGLLDGETRPRTFAVSLVLRHYGITSRGTLYKDRRKLKAAGLPPK